MNRDFSGREGRMIKFLRIFFLLCPIIFAMIGCAASHMEEHPGQASKETKVLKNKAVLMPAKSHEDCVVLKNGQVLVCQFSSDGPLDFNIHYHTEHEVQYPVVQREITEYWGIFDPEKENLNLENEEYFCMMWENKDVSRVRLSYEFTVKEK